MVQASQKYPQSSKGGNHRCGRTGVARKKRKHVQNQKYSGSAWKSVVQSWRTHTKKPFRKRGGGDENNRPRTASPYTSSAVTVKGTGVLNELVAGFCPAFPCSFQGG